MASRAFSFTELLVVVAIIAILAAIAVPNFLEAQTRAKVARTRADLRTLATAVEAYSVDHNAPPMNDGRYNIPPVELTTPVAYITNSEMIDPFAALERHPYWGALAHFYTYTEVVDHETAMVRSGLGRPAPLEGIDHPDYNPGAFDKYGPWRLASNGPDREYALPGWVPGCDPLDPNDILLGIDVRYDPTNGTVSGGNLLRTARDSD